MSFVHSERRGDIRNLGAGTRWDRTGSGVFNGKTYDTGQGVSFSPKWLGSKNVETYFGALKFEPSDTFRMVYKYDRSVDHSTPEGVAVTAINTSQPSAGAGGVIIGALAANQPAGGGPFGPIVLNPSSRRPKTVNNFYTVPSYLKNQGHNLTAQLTLADNITVRNIAAYRKSYLQEATSQIGGLGGLVVTQEGLNALGAALIPNFAVIPAAFRPGALAALGASLGGVNPAVVGSRLVDVGTNIQNLSRQWSNELQINIDTDPVTLTVGGIYFHSKDRSGSPQFSRGTAQLSFFPATGENPLGGLSAPTAVSYNKATSYAAYAQAEIHVLPTLDLVLGGRVTRDKKSGTFVSGINPLLPTATATTGTFTSTVPGCPATSNPVGVCRTAGIYAGLNETSFVYSDTRPIYSIGLNYQPNSDVLAYVKYSTGYVSGGAIGGISFEPETVRSFEAGLKADFLNRRLRTNLAVFYAKYKDVQTASSGRNIFDAALQRFRTDLGTAIITGYDEKTYGFELEVTAVPIDRLTLGASLGYTHIDQSNYNPLYVGGFLVTGQELADVRLRPTGTPKWTSNLSAQYETEPLFGESTLLLRLDAIFRSRLYFDANRDRSTLIPAYKGLESGPPQWILNSRVALRDVRFGQIKTELALWARNLTDNKDPLFPLLVPFVGSSSYQQSRTFGLDLIFRY